MIRRYYNTKKKKHEWNTFKMCEIVSRIRGCTVRLKISVKYTYMNKKHFNYCCTNKYISKYKINNEILLKCMTCI